MRQQPQLDLRVVGGEQHKAGLGHEGRADLAPQLSADRNVLQVRVDRRQPACRRSRHVERCMQPLGARIQQRRQRVHVGRLQLRELTIFQHHLRHIVLGGQTLQHIDRGRDRLALAVLDGLGQVQPVEEHVAQLLGRIDVELEVAPGVNLARLHADVVVQPPRHVGKHVAVELDAGFFHARQHRHQRQINLVVNLAQVGLVDLVTQLLGQPQRDIGGLCVDGPIFRLNLRNATSGSA